MSPGLVGLGTSQSAGLGDSQGTRIEDSQSTVLDTSQSAGLGDPLGTGFPNTPRGELSAFPSTAKGATPPKRPTPTKATRV